MVNGKQMCAGEEVGEDSRESFTYQETVSQAASQEEMDRKGVR